MTWRERIAAARERGRFSDEEKDLAAMIETCAVGEAASTIGRGYVAVNFERPRTFRLAPHMEQFEHERTVGMHFLMAVQAHNFDAADDILDAIEDHLLTLKRRNNDDVA